MVGGRAGPPDPPPPKACACIGRKAWVGEAPAEPDTSPAIFVCKGRHKAPKLRELEEWKAGRLGTPASEWSICTCGPELIPQSPLDAAHPPMIRRRLLVSAFSPSFQASTPPIFRSSGKAAGGGKGGRWPQSSGVPVGCRGFQRPVLRELKYEA